MRSLQIYKGMLYIMATSSHTTNQSANVYIGLHVKFREMADLLDKKINLNALALLDS